MEFHQNLLLMDVLHDLTWTCHSAGLSKGHLNMVV